MGALVERNYPWLAGLVVAGLCFWGFRTSTIPVGTKDLMTSFLNIAAIIVGFLVTSKAILLSIDTKWIIQRSKESGAYGMLVGYMVSATYWWMAAAFLSAVGLALIPATPLADWQKPYAVALFSGWVFVAVTASLAAFRVLNIFSIVLQTLSRS
jgi:hypothetical protein